MYFHEQDKNIDIKLYRGMIGSLLYLTASRPGIMFSMCLCARFQFCPKESNLIAGKHIIRYLKGTIGMGLWYPKTGQFSITNFSDADMQVVEWIGRVLVELSVFKKLPYFMVFQEVKFCTPLNCRGGVCCDRGLLCISHLDETYSP